jgi:hypothetical protein
MRSQRQFLIRLGVLAATCCVGIGVMPQGAYADPVGPECSDDTDDCEIEVQLPGDVGDGDGDFGNGGGAAPGSGGGTDPEGVFTDCTATVEETDAQTHPIAGDRPAGDQVLVTETCTSATGETIKRVRWMSESDGALEIDPELLAQWAVDRLVLPQPVIGASPAEVQLVNLPVWLSVTTGSWRTQTAEASLPGWQATATATPVQADWDMGDGTTVTCTDRGAEWSADLDPEAESECGHTYQQPASGLDVSVTVLWRIDWSVTGPSGTTTDTAPDMTTTRTDTWMVTESHALNTR